MSDESRFGEFVERETPECCELCRTEPDLAELRPVCVVGRSRIPLMCDPCYSVLRTAGRLDLERDAEVFGYAE